MVAPVVKRHGSGQQKAAVAMMTQSAARKEEKEKGLDNGNLLGYRLRGSLCRAGRAVL